jgi:glycosyltransferase involved in cell wall biosynthesis
MEQYVEGTRVLRTAIYPTQKVSLLPRLTSYFSFVLSSWLIGGWFVNKPDYILTESPPLFLGIAGYFLSRWKKARWIFNVSDLWPESAVRLGMLKPGLALKLSQTLEAFCYRMAWLVTGQSRDILFNIEKRFPEVNTFHLSNGVNTNTFRPDRATTDARASLGNEETVIVMYAGLHGLAQGLEQILEAARILRDEPYLKFVLIGDGPQKKDLIDQAERHELHNLVFHDPVPSTAMPEIVASVDICIVPLKTYIPGAVPSKLYESMAAGRALILMADGEAAEIIAQNEAGVVVHPGDIEGLVDTIRALVHDGDLRRRLGDAGREAATIHYDRRKIIDRFVNFLEEAEGHE